MNLFLFPEAAYDTNGYGIAVKEAYMRLSPQAEDDVVWITSIPKERMQFLREKDYILNRAKYLSIKSVINILKKTNRSEPSVNDLSFLKGKTYDNIYCDETLFYHAIRKLFPKQKLTVRFHNSFARIHDRLKLLQDRSVDLMYQVTLNNMYCLERDVMNDKNVYKIFLTEEDRYYYTSHYGITSDSEVYDFGFDYDAIKKNRISLQLDHRLIWYGGLESHKLSSVEWFVNKVLPVVRKSIPDIEFHLWGKGTQPLDNPSVNVFGHGFFEGDDMPSRNSLYVNPDIIGGGIKIKLMSLLNSGVPVISSPFGFEGYSHHIIDDEYCIVQEENKWAEFIITYLKKHSI